MEIAQIKREREVNELGFVKTVVGYRQSENIIKREFKIRQHQLDVLMVVQSFYERAELPIKRQIVELLNMNFAYQMPKAVDRATDEEWIIKQATNENQVREKGKKKWVYGVSDKGRQVVTRLKELALYNAG